MNIKTIMNLFCIHNFQSPKDSTEEYGGQDEKQRKTN